MHKLHLPRLGQTMERGTVLHWLKDEGESFDIGEVLYEVETEKVTSEIEAKLPGMLAKITIEEGEEYPVGTLLAVVADPGEELSQEDVEEAIAEESDAASEPGAGEVEQPHVEPESAPERSAGKRVRAMPKARALARELGVEISAVEGTGKNGAITADDVRKAASGSATSGSVEPAVKERRQLQGVARAMAEVVTRSWREVPQFVQMVELDASNLVEWRRSEAENVKASHGIDLSYTDLFLYALARAVEEQPLANSSLVDSEILVYKDVNVSVAVAAESGLLVPVVRQAQSLSLGELAVRLREVADRAREGTLSQEDTEGGTITLSNLGMYGIEGGTPLVTQPQAVVVFFGSIVERPTAVSGEVEVRPMMSMSIGYDHRILDGVSAARFTTALRRTIEGT